MDTVELYDDLVAIRRTLYVMEDASMETQDDLTVVLGRIMGKLKESLLALPEDDREDVIACLDEDYDGCAREDLEAML